MPTYDYRCGACGHEFEEFQSITADPLRKCPACGRSSLERVIGPGAGFLFRGDGFYTTDYRSKSYQDGKSAEKGGGSGEASSGKEKGSGSSGGASSGGASSGGGSKGSSGSDA